MIINATQVREGMVLVIEGELCRVTWTMHRTPGKGNAVMQTKLKNILTGKNTEARFMSSERVEKADLETRTMQYLYPEADGHVFMDDETFEQHTLNNDLIGEETSQYLTEGQGYSVTYYQDQAVGIELPKSMEFKVISAPPEVKRATATNSQRAITLERGITVNAPGFIKEGDVVRINTETGEYMERVSS